MSRFNREERKEMHEWMRDPERRGEGLVCRQCGVTEAELEATPRLAQCPCEAVPADA
jgi:hypothetical protein